jgi:hypothetical protein
MGTGEGHISVSCFCCIWHSNYTRYCSYCYHLCYWYRDGRERMVVRFTSTCAISAYHHKSCDFKSCSWRGIPDRTYVIKFVSDLQQVGGFIKVLRFPPPIKLTARDDFFFSYLTDFSYFSVKKNCEKLQDTVRTGQRLPFWKRV